MARVARAARRVVEGCMVLVVFGGWFVVVVLGESRERESLIQRRCFLNEGQK